MQWNYEIKPPTMWCIIRTSRDLSLRLAGNLKYPTITRLFEYTTTPYSNDCSKICILSI